MAIKDDWTSKRINHESSDFPDFITFEDGIFKIFTTDENDIGTVHLLLTGCSGTDYVMVQVQFEIMYNSAPFIEDMEDAVMYLAMETSAYEIPEVQDLEGNSDIYMVVGTNGTTNMPHFMYYNATSGEIVVMSRSNAD